MTRTDTKSLKLLMAYGCGFLGGKQRGGARNGLKRAITLSVRGEK